MSRLPTKIWNNFGHCTYCMRSAFRWAVVASALTLVGWLVALPVTALAAMTVVSISAILLAIAHVVVFALKRSRPASSSETDISDVAGVSRRQLFARFASAVGTGVTLSLATPAMARRVQLAQEYECPAGSNDCGNGYCCPADTPHFCPGSNRCYQYYTDAQADCGSNFVVCGRPAG